jgi:adenylate kinase
VFSPPHTAGVFDIDGSELYQRADDKPDTVRARMAQQLGALAEVIAHYRESGTLLSVDGLQGIDAVAHDIDAALVGSGLATPAGGEAAR